MSFCRYFQQESNERLNHQPLKEFYCSRQNATISVMDWLRMYKLGIGRIIRMFIGSYRRKAIVCGY